MQYRPLGRTGWNVSSISFGAWAIGGTWGDVDDSESMAALHKAVEMGVNFIDTADVYGDGRSERLVAQLKKDHPDIRLATKAGRRLPSQTPDAYTRENLTTFVERSLKNLETEAIDLLQLHCPPTELYYMPEKFAILDDLVAAGKLLHYGVSVEKVEEALKAIEFPNVQSVQIIFNIFRQRPMDLFFEQAQKREVGILARVPLASGLLTGKFNRDSKFPTDDHRHFNRDGAAFDKGETFSGVDYESGLDAVEELAALCPDQMSLVQLALRWITMHEAVTCAIPGAKKVHQVEENVRAADLPELPAPLMAKIAGVYERRVKESVHHFW